MYMLQNMAQELSPLYRLWGMKEAEEGAPRRQSLRAVSRSAEMSGKWKDPILLCNFLNNFSRMDQQDMRFQNSKILGSIFSILSLNVGFCFSHRCSYNL